MAYALFKNGKQVGDAHETELEAATAAMEAGAMAVFGRALSATEIKSLYDIAQERGIRPANRLGVALADGYEIRPASDASPPPEAG